MSVNTFKKQRRQLVYSACAFALIEFKGGSQNPKRMVFGWMLANCQRVGERKEAERNKRQEKLLSFENKHFHDMPPHPYHFMDGCGAILYERHTSERRKEALNPKP